MKIVFIKDCGVYLEGDVADLKEHARAQQFINGGFAELAKEEKAFVEKVAEAKEELKEAKKEKKAKPKKAKEEKAEKAE